MRVLLMLVCYAATVSTPCAQQEPRPTVGIATEISQLVLPGTELVVHRVEDRHDPLVLRIKAVFRHGDAFRYDLVYYGLEPGTYDLREYLERKDGSGTDDLPAIPVKVHALLPMLPIEPNALQPKSVEGPGGYRLTLYLVAGCWLLGLGLMFRLRRQRRSRQEASQDRPLSLADHLAPRVEAALHGTLSIEGQAELERMLLVFWRRRLGLNNMRASEAMVALRTHAEAGPLLEQLELWLHRPPGESVGVDVAALLEPYRALAADSWNGDEKHGEDPQS